MTHREANRLDRQRHTAPFVLAFLLVAASCSVGSAGDEIESSPDTTLRGVVSDEEATERAGGFGVSGDSVDAGLVSVRSATPDDLPSLPVGMQFVDDPFLVDAPPGIEPLEISFDASEVDADELHLAHLDRFGRWEFKQPFFDGERAYVLTNSFSPVGWVTGAADWVIDGVTGRSDPPDDCDLTGSGGVDWADHTGSPGNEVAHVCMRSRDDGRVELAIRSNRAEPIEVLIPDTMTPDFVWVEGMSDWATPIFAALLSSPGSYVLGPGRDMTIGFSQPIGQVPAQEFWIFQTGKAKAWGQMAELVNGWDPDVMAFHTVLCYTGGADETDTSNDSLVETFAGCVQDGLPDAIEDVTIAELDRRADAAYLRFAQEVDADNLRWTRGTVDEFAEKFGDYRAAALKADSVLARAKSFFSAVRSSILIVDVYSNIAVDLFGEDDANVSRVFLTGRCSFSGPLASMTVTGVTDDIAVRDDPDIGAEEIARVGGRSAVEVFVGSERSDDLRAWVPVWIESANRCGWIPADHVKRGDGTLVERPLDAELLASEMIRRSLIDEEPELLIAPLEYETSDSEGFAVDRARFEAPFEELGALPDDVAIEPALPADLEASALSPACAFPSHGIICTFELRDGSGEIVARVETGQYGDGITSLSIIDGEAPPTESSTGVSATGYQNVEGVAPYPCHGTETLGSRRRVISVESDDVLNARTNAGVSNQIVTMLGYQSEVYAFHGFPDDSLNERFTVAAVGQALWVMIELPGPGPFEEPAQYGCGWVNASFLASPTHSNLAEELRAAG